jgi:hypothetical protein
MTTIRTTCANLACGNLELTIDQVQLVPNGHYRFVCPNCFTMRTLPTSPRIVAVLMAAGVQYVPITEDEIDLFVMELDLREGIER